MTRLEAAFDESRRRIASGEATLETCLARYPEHADRLAVLLAAAARLEQLPATHLSGSARALGRNRLRTHMSQYPRAAVARRLPSFLSPRRWAPVLAAIALALTAGTAAAQSAGPGDLLYAWRQASETAWLNVAPNRRAAALAVAQRRLDDLLQSTPNTARYGQAFGAYEAWIRLMEADNLVDAESELSLDRQRQQLRSKGIDVPEIDHALGGPPQRSGQATPSSAPSVTPSSPVEVAPPVLGTPSAPGPHGPGGPTLGPPTQKSGPGGPANKKP
jgi:hypothetical protein